MTKVNWATAHVHIKNPRHRSVWSISLVVCRFNPRMMSVVLVASRSSIRTSPESMLITNNKGENITRLSSKAATEKTGKPLRQRFSNCANLKWENLQSNHHQAQILIKLWHTRICSWIEEIVAFLDGDPGFWAFNFCLKLFLVDVNSGWWWKILKYHLKHLWQLLLSILFLLAEGSFNLRCSRLTPAQTKHPTQNGTCQYSMILKDAFCKLLDQKKPHKKQRYLTYHWREDILLLMVYILHPTIYRGLIHPKSFSIWPNSNVSPT